MTSPHPNAATRPQEFAGKVGIFYCTSNRLGAPHNPTIMTLSGGELSAVTADGTVLFSAPVREFSSRFTRWGTIILTHRTKLFRFVTGGYAGTSARAFSDAQKQELADAGATEPDDGTGYMAGALASQGGRVSTNLTHGAGGVLGIATQALGVATMFREQRSAFKYSLLWAQVLDAAGVPTSYSTTSYAASMWTAAAIALPAIAIVSAVPVLLIAWAMSSR